MHGESLRVTTIFTGLARSFLDVLFPPRCRLCGSATAEGESFFCEECVPLIEAERRQPACPRCGTTVAPYEVSGGRCAECRESHLHVKATARVGEYFGCLAQMVRAYKFARREEFEPILSAFLVDAIARTPWFDGIEAVVPVPTHWTRRIRRPFHPAETIASRVAAEAGLPLVHVLRRTRGGPHQIGLSYTARLNNVRGAFAVRSNLVLDKSRLLVVDDVRTTGATLEECAKVLHRNGAAGVHAAVLVTVSGARPGAAILSTI